MIAAVFPAAGQGKRMRAGMNKVFLELAGLPILVHTLRRFSQSAKIDYLIVIAAEEEVEEIRRLLQCVPKLKPFQVVAGSTERQYSIANGLAVLPDDTEVVLVHDAARPLVTVQTIEAVIKAAQETGGAIAAVPEKNTIKLVSSDGMVVKTPPREMLWEVQTPQGFCKDILLEAYRRAKEENFLGTDDSSLVERLQIPVKVVESDYQNIKITTPEDLVIAEALLRAQNELKSTLQEAAGNTKD